MNTRILYFASLRERVGRDAEDFALPQGVDTIAKLRAHLAARGEGWETFALGKNLRAAVNQKMAQPETAVAAGDEIAFFPPVTGG